MRIRQLALSLVLFAALNTVGYPIFEPANLRCRDGVIYIDRQGTLLFDSSFATGMAQWVSPLVNYENKLTLGCATYEGEAVFLAELKGEKCDTAWEIESKPFAVTGDTDYTFTIRARSSLSFLRPTGHKGLYNTKLQWLNAKGEPLDEPRRFGFDTRPDEWIESVIEGRTPAAAAQAVIYLGGDRPNFNPGDFLAISGCQFTLKPQDSPCHPKATFLSSPLPLTAEPSIAWDAECPPGTSVTFQIATADDAQGKPGTWTPFHGPDNSPQSFYTQPQGQKLAATPAKHKWIRYQATLTSNKTASPVLKAVTIAGAKDADYVVGDKAPPVLTMLSQSPTEDTMAPIQFRLDDQSLLVKPSVKFFLDDIDLTAKLTASNGVFTYQPEQPIKPPGFSTSPRSWQRTNYVGALTFTEPPDEPSALRVTRDKPNVDTSFTLTSWPAPVLPNQTYRILFTVRHDVPLFGNKGKHNVITWRDAEHNVIGKPVPFELGAECTVWKNCELKVTSPANAVTATVRFGFDIPNLYDGHYFDILEVKFEGPAGKEDLTGRLNLHTVRIMAEDMAGCRLDEERVILYDKPATSNIVTMRDDGFVLIDGKPFFPIGLYAVWKKDFNNNSFDVAFQGLKDAGFNFAHTYNSARNEEFTEFLDAADRHGIKLWITKSDVNNFQSEKRRPSILAWYLGDDTSMHIPPEVVRKNHLLCHAMDNAHLTTQADGVGGGGGGNSNYTAYVHATDSFLPEIYPMHGATPTPTEVPQVIQDMKTIYEDLKLAGSPVKSIWAIIQHFEGWGWQRYPTHAEQRAMTYLAIIHGAHGVTWYTYGGRGKNHGVTHTPEQWQLICSVAGELAQLKDVLTSRNAKTQPTATVTSGPTKDSLGFPSISCLLKDNVAPKILLTANSSPEAVQAKIPLAGLKKVTVLFENRTLDAKDGISDNFAPFDVHVYQLEY
ncbi:MAG: hypothetical protein ACOX6W_01215 [Lentisphaeria bacterium]